MNPNFKLYYIIPAVALVMVIIILLVLPKGTKPPAKPVPTNTPLPTLIPTEIQFASSVPKVTPTQGTPPTPTLIPPTFTGAFEDQHIPQSETDLAVQKSDLRKKTPLTQPGFTITFDYANDQFVVTLNEPKDTNRDQFLQWLQTNYSAIPLDRFNIR